MGKPAFTPKQIETFVADTTPRRACAGLIEEGDTLRYTLHQLRHTRCTELIEEGKSLEIVQRVLGHRDIRSTQGYVDLSEAQVRNALEGAHLEETRLNAYE